MNKLLVPINWLLVFVGCLLVVQTAHTLFFSQSSSDPSLVPTVSSSDPVATVVRPVEDAGGANVGRAASPEPSSSPSSVPKTRQTSPVQRKARPTPRVRTPAPNPLIEYDRPPASEADRLGL